jgi:hypothetical protein
MAGSEHAIAAIAGSSAKNQRMRSGAAGIAGKEKTPTVAGEGVSG